MTSGKQFKTALARRQGKPITFDVEAWVFDPPEPNPWTDPLSDPPEDWQNPIEDHEGHAETVELMVDPLLDILKMAGSLGGFQEALQAITSGGDQQAAVSKLDGLLPAVKASLRQCLVPPSRLKWDEIADSLDISIVGQIIRYIATESSGLDPTQPASSSTGSPGTGATSTGGPQPAA